MFVRLQSAEARERQQLKWFAYGAAVFLGALFLRDAAYQKVGPWAAFVVIVTGLSAFPVAIGVAILRYRLYDIDTLINRTLVYGSLTAILVAHYFGSIIWLQIAFVELTGQRSTLAVVASTLVIAALFRPWQRWVQAFVDRRFYRRKYDARKTLEEFSAKLRNETDLDALNSELLSTVRQTVQPEHV